LRGVRAARVLQTSVWFSLASPPPDDEHINSERYACSPREPSERLGLRLARCDR
jgi:hypothetical protein